MIPPAAPTPLPTLTEDERHRYARQIVLYGETAQRRLKAARVAVVGAGGLGCPLLQYLAAAGVGTLAVYDADVIQEHNLQRQTLYTTADCNKPKATVAAERLTALNPYCVVKPYVMALTAQNALQALHEYDIIVDGSDNFATRYLINDACCLLAKPLVWGAVYQFEGQVSVLNALLPDGSRSANYRDLYPSPPAAGTVLDCAEGGILGVLPGIVGAMQGLEVLKLITGVGSPLYNRLCLINGLDGTMRTLRFSPDPDNPLTGTQPTQKTLIDYAAFCGTAGPVRDLSPAELWALQSEGRLAALIDVRTEAEYADCNIGGIRLSIQEAAQRIPQTGIVVVHCHSGARSAAAIRQLQTQYGYTNLYNLAGGIAAWIAAGYPAIHTQTA